MATAAPSRPAVEPTPALRWCGATTPNDDAFIVRATTSYDCESFDAVA